jgi:glycosyltransferase involved in cell wall biosynthesis
MKNVCYFNTIKFWLGVEKLHLEYAIEFEKKGYNVWLASNKNAVITEKANKLGLKCFHTSAGSLSFLNPIKLLKLIRFYKKNNIDTIIFSTSQDAKLGSYSAMLARVKNIVYLRGLAAVIKNSLVNRLMFNKMITHVAVNSDATKNKVLQNLKKQIDDSKVARIYHGIEIGNSKSKSSQILPEIKEKGKGIILGNAGRLTLQKGQQHLIEVARILEKRHINFTLFIAGTGELQSELELKITEYNLQKQVILLGFVDDMEAFNNSIDIFLLSSEWEGFGYVIVEALAKEKPVVAFNISSNPEIISQNKTGFLVDFADIESFANKTQELIENENLRLEMGKAGLQSVHDRFDIKDRITEFEYCILGKNQPIN